MKKSKKRWIITIRCKVIKEIICDCIDEREIEQPDWDIQAVKEDK